MTLRTRWFALSLAVLWAPSARWLNVHLSPTLSRMRERVGERVSATCLIAGLMAALSGCFDSSDPVAASTATVNVTLSEWSVTLDAATVAAGLVKFQVKNAGPNDTHEFVVVKTDLAPEQLPVDANGVVVENGAGIAIIGEIEGIPVGADTHIKAFDLAPGKYVLICNIWDAGEKEAHYHQGMRVAFTVQ